MEVFDQKKKKKDIVKFLTKREKEYREIFDQKNNKWKFLTKKEKINIVNFFTKKRI
jgi:hypothetical protein